MCVDVSIRDGWALLGTAPIHFIIWTDLHYFFKRTQKTGQKHEQD